MSNIGIALLDAQCSAIDTVIEFKGEKASYQGKIVPQPLVQPGTPIPKKE